MIPLGITWLAEYLYVCMILYTISIYSAAKPKNLGSFTLLL